MIFSFLRGWQRTAETVFSFHRCTDRKWFSVSCEVGRERRKRFSVSERVNTMSVPPYLTAIVKEALDLDPPSVPLPLPPLPRLGSQTPPPSLIRQVNGHGHSTMTQPAPDQLTRRRCWTLEWRLTAVTGGGLRRWLKFSMDDCSLLKCPRGWMSPEA